MASEFNFRYTLYIVLAYVLGIGHWYWQPMSSMKPQISGLRTQVLHFIILPLDASSPSLGTPSRAPTLPRDDGRPTSTRRWLLDVTSEVEPTTAERTRVY